MTATTCLVKSVTCLGLAALLCTCGQGVTPSAARAQAPKRPADLTKVKPNFSMTAEQFFEEYKKDSDATDKKYQRAVIELTGVVKMMGARPGLEPFVTLEAGTDLFGVTCLTADREPWARVSPGQQVKLKGRYPAFSIGAGLLDCVFVETGTNPAVVMTAEELAKEYAADREATARKYRNKYLVLTGVVAKKEQKPMMDAAVFLKGSGKVQLKCVVNLVIAREMTAPVKVGQKIKVTGRFDDFSKTEVGLTSALVIRQAK